MQSLVRSPVLLRPSVLSLRVPAPLLAAVAVVSDRCAAEEDSRQEQGLLPYSWFALLAVLSHTRADTKQSPPVKGTSPWP